MSNARSPARRRRKPSPVRKLRPFWFLLVLVLALGAIGAYVLVTWPALYPHTIEVSGNRIVARSAIEDAAHIDLTRNMWLQNTRAMRDRIEAIPYVDEAQVHRRPPDTLAIRVSERAPYAVVRGANALVTIDDTLRVLQSGAALASLPVFAVPAVPLPAPGKWIQESAVDTLARVAAHAARAHLDSETLGYDKFGDIVLRLRSGVSVQLGDGSDLDKKLAMVEPILTQVQHGSKRIASIDLRAITTPVVVYAK